MKTTLPRLIGISLLCAGVLALGACSKKAPEPTAQPTAAASVATPWDSLKKDEQRARDVQQVVDKQAADQSKQIDDASR